MRVGLVSDTHGSLPDRVLELFAGVERILHAGDVGAAWILEALAAVAPVTAVRGNCDVSGEAAQLPALVNAPIGGTRFLVVHEPAHVPRPVPDAVGVVVFGHTHVPFTEVRNGVVWVNPGSPSNARRGHGHHVAVLDTAAPIPLVSILDLD